MTTLRTSVQDYLTMRRGLGFKLHDAGVGLLDFVAFMERRRAARITMDLALERATKSKAAQPAPRFHRQVCCRIVRSGPAPTFTRSKRSSAY